jgi:hypothetical protein
MVSEQYSGATVVWGLLDPTRPVGGPLKAGRIRGRLRATGRYSEPEVGFEEISSDLLQARFWITSELPTSTSWLDFADAKGVLLSLEAVNPLFIPHRSQ